MPNKLSVLNGKGGNLGINAILNQNMGKIISNHKIEEKADSKLV